MQCLPYFLSTHMHTHTCMSFACTHMHAYTCSHVRACHHSCTIFFLIYPCTQKHRHASLHTYWAVMDSSVLPEILPYLSRLSHKSRCHLSRNRQVSCRWWSNCRKNNDDIFSSGRSSNLSLHAHLGLFLWCYWLCQCGLGSYKSTRCCYHPVPILLYHAWWFHQKVLFERGTTSEFNHCLVDCYFFVRHVHFLELVSGWLEDALFPACCTMGTHVAQGCRYRQSGGSEIPRENDLCLSCWRWVHSGTWGHASSSPSVRANCWCS